MNLLYQNTTFFFRSVSRLSLTLLVIITGNFISIGQCPANIDFEDGTFNGWTCWIGSVAAVGGRNVITLNPSGGPVFNRHEMLSANPGNGLDEYGFFPKNCPNGSGYSIKLGNNSGGAQAEGVSYQFTIPATANKFSLIYYYAVVFQDPGHLTFQQPRLEIDIENLTDNTTVGCSSFSFIANSGLPGFFQSTNPQGNTPVWCKDWSATSINLDGNAGKTIRLFFKTADCTFSAHFGYAYVDVNTECSSSFVGATFCSDDTAINVTAPYGYQNYTWYSSSFTQVLGTQQVLNLSPPPPAGSTIAVELIPFNGYGCKDTLYAQLLDTLTVVANAGPDKLACNNTPVQIGEPPRQGLVYRWTPTTGLNNPNISNPIASPNVSTTYVLRVTHDGGGCRSTDTVLVNAGYINDSLQVIGSTAYCAGSGNTILKVHPTDSIQWFKDGVAIAGANQTQYVVTQSGSYYAKLFTNSGCSASTVVQQINIFTRPVAGFTINNASQCFAGNQFMFTNTSTTASGTLQYSWNLGDGNTATSSDVIHAYSQAGTYVVKLLVTGGGGCKDSVSFNVNVTPSPTAGFTINNANQCFKNNRFVFTNTSTASSGTLLYYWTLGDGTIVTTRDVTYSYTQPGTYTVKLLVTAAGGCKDSTLFSVTINPSPTAGFTVNNVNQCFTGHQFIFTNTSSVSSGNLQYRWNLGDGTILTTPDVSYTYRQAGTYTVKLFTSAAGSCVDSISVIVTVYPNPTADYSVQPVCINLNVPVFNKTINNTTSTINYLWDFGDGQSSTLRNPAFSYSTPGTYIIKLTVNTTQCPNTVSTKQLNITIDAPLPGINYSVKNAVINFPLQLQARAFGKSILWSPAVSLNDPFSYAPVFKGPEEELYTIQIQTLTGCITVDTQLVKTFKKIEIFVPTAFTPNGDGKNDHLRPILLGFKKLNYFKVYNRWGQLLFQMSNDESGWDGKVKGIPQDTQAVVWMIEAIDVDGIIHKQQGSSVLIR